MTHKAEGLFWSSAWNWCLRHTLWWAFEELMKLSEKGGWFGMSADFRMVCPLIRICKWDHTLFLRSLPHESAWRCREIEAGLKKALADIQGSKGCISRRLIELRYQTDPNAITAHRTWPFQNFKWSVALLDCCDFLSDFFCSSKSVKKYFPNHWGFTQRMGFGPPRDLRRTIWQLETPVAAPPPGANMPLSPSSVANAERMEKLSRTIWDYILLYIFFFSKGYQVIITLWVVDDCFFVLWNILCWFDCEVLTLPLCFLKFRKRFRFLKIFAAQELQCSQDDWRAATWSEVGL